MKEFLKDIYGTFEIDQEYELYVLAWTAYHRAANKVDGHLPPDDPDQGKLGRYAVSAGYNAMDKYIPWCHRPNLICKDPRDESYAKWHRAKLEACHIVENEDE